MEENQVLHCGLFWAVLAILQWWGFNVTVIIMNKWIFQKLEFKFPLSVSCIHFICSAIGAYVAIKLLRVKPLIVVSAEDRWRRIFPMSFVFCINIVLGNVSLRYIPVSFMQTIKSFTPATTVILQWLVWRKHFDWRIWLSLVPIVGGILLTSMTELSFNVFGFCAALFGCVATSTKTILAESLLHGFKFDSINSVYYMAPYATMILAVPAARRSGSHRLVLHTPNPSFVIDHYRRLGGVGLLSQFLHLLCHAFHYRSHLQCSRQSQGVPPPKSVRLIHQDVNHRSQVAVAVLVSWLVFRNPISAMNALGCAVTLSGCTFYGYVRHRLSQQPGTRPPPTPQSRFEMVPLVIDKLDTV